MDSDVGYRLNVGIIVINDHKQVLLAKRFGIHNAWQFPQGGIHEGETTLDAMYRELHEELGLLPEDVEMLAESQQWLKYKLPTRFIRYHETPRIIGQKQKWFLLRLVADEAKILFDHVEKPEFDEWKWVDHQYPADHVISFKREVYKQILEEFSSFFR